MINTKIFLHLKGLGHAVMDVQNWLYKGKFEKRQPVFFQIYLTLHESVILCPEIIAGLYVAVVLPTQDYCSANVKFRADYDRK